MIVVSCQPEPSLRWKPYFNFWLILMLLANFISMSSFKEIIFNDNFFFIGEGHDFHKMTPTNVSLKITVNKKP